MVFDTQIAGYGASSTVPKAAVMCDGAVSVATASVAAAEVVFVVDEAFFDVEGGPCAAGDFAMVELDDFEMDLFEREGFEQITDEPLEACASPRRDPSQRRR